MNLETQSQAKFISAYLERLFQDTPEKLDASIHAASVRDGLLIEVKIAGISRTEKKYITKSVSDVYKPGTPIKEFCLNLDGVLFRKEWRHL